METHLKQLCEALNERTRVSVVVSNERNTTVHEQIDGVSITRVARWFEIARTSICPGMAKAIRGVPADIIHLHHPNPWAMLAYLASGHRGKLVITYHSDIVKQKVLVRVVAPLLNLVFGRAAAIIATSPNYLESSEMLNRYRDRCRVIPLGIPLQPLMAPHPADLCTIRAAYGKDIILATGRLVYYKGFEYLIKAMSGLKAHLLLAGEGPLRSQLEGLARDAGVADRVHFLGRVPDMVPYYQAADIFVLPSIARSEAFGMVQLEAMALGVPVVNTNLDTGVPFVSLHGLTGLTVAPADADALHSAIASLLADRDLAARFGAAAKLRVEQEFSLEVMVARTLTLYQEVRNARTPHLQPANAPRATQQAEIPTTI